MAARPPVGLGDLVTVLDALGLLGAELSDQGSLDRARGVARALGMQGAARSASPFDGRRTLPGSASMSAAATITTRAVVVPRAPTATPLPGGGGTRAFDVRLEIARGKKPSALMYSFGPQLPAPPVSEATEEPPPLAPLFSPRSSRSLVSTSLSTWHLDGEVDIARLVHRVASLRPVLRVPRRSQLSIRHGVQVLVDYGPGLDPFARDAAALVAQIRRIAACHRVQVLRFASDPLMAGPGPRRTWVPYRPPPAGTRVIALTDLGIAAPRLRLPPPHAEWRALGSRVAQAGASLLCIVPYPPMRWPIPLVRELPIVSWDRTTTVAHLRRLVGGRRH